MSLLAATLQNVVFARFHADDLSSAALYAWAAARLEGESAASELIDALCSQFVGRAESARRAGDHDLASQLDGLRAILDVRIRQGSNHEAMARCRDAERALLRGQLESAAGFSLAALAQDPGHEIATRRLREAAEGLGARRRAMDPGSPTLEGTLDLALVVALGLENQTRALATLLYGLGDFELAARLCQRIEADAAASFSDRFAARELLLQAHHRSLQADQASAEALAACEIRDWLIALGPASDLGEEALRTRLRFCFGYGGYRQTLADLRALRSYNPTDPWVAANLCVILLNVLHPDVAASVDIVVQHTSDELTELKARYDLMAWIGAMPQALVLAERLARHHPEYAVIGALHQMATDLDAEPAHVFGRSRRGGRLVYASLVCWGERYIDLMESVAIASLLAPGNIPALSEKADLVVELYTNPADAKGLRDSSLLEQLARFCEIRIHCFPDLVAAQNAAFSYATFGYAAHATALRAERDGADITFLMPDVIYADGGYSLIAERLTSAPRVVFVDGLNAYAAPMQDRMRQFREGDALIVPPLDLIEASLGCLSRRTLHSIYRPGDGQTCVEPSRVIFPMEGGLRTHAFAMNPVYVSHAALAPFLAKNFATPDGRICEHILNGVDDDQLEVLSADQFAYIEICADDGMLNPMADISLIDAVRGYFVRYGLGRNRLRLFERPINFPTRLPPNLPLVSPDEVAAQLRGIQAMFATDPALTDLAEEQERVRLALYQR